MPAILVSDVKLPAWTGSDYCASPWGGEDLPIISVTGHGDITMAVQAMREGAC
jgi:FixJ family two-component response regulator